MSERSIVFRTPPDGVDVVHSVLDALWLERPDIDEMDRMMFETALIELAANVIQHATSTTTIVCQLEIGADDLSLHARLIDTADPPDIDTSPREMPDVFAESGRGLAFIQALVNEFEHRRSDGHNVWTLSKKRTPSDA